ncbi:MAG: NTP transferase domain-containing protein [Rickettsiales bacterium]|jgi:glucose-1-phosphate thymidylyltransferase|nr:NTP transferase domain-containing protein [Rickettsiales bacterium]
MKGIIMAGGLGSRLFPTTKSINKHLIPIYDKPMIYYPLSTLMQFGIEDITLISTPGAIDMFRELLGDGERFGISIRYFVQKEPRGIAEAFPIASDFLGNDDVCLILGDNIFYIDPYIEKIKEQTLRNKDCASILCRSVRNPKEYGVVELSRDGRVLSLVEKPSDPKSNQAVVGLYFYPNDVVKKANTLKFSNRNELEITDLNKLYMDEGRLNVIKMTKNCAWFDAGTVESYIRASNFVRHFQIAGNQMLSCPEEIALIRGYIGKSELASTIKAVGFENYYLRHLKEIFGRDV